MSWYNVLDTILFASCRGKVLLRRKENLRKLYEYYYTNMCKIFLIGINITSSDTRYLWFETNEDRMIDISLSLAEKEEEKKKEEFNIPVNL